MIRKYKSKNIKPGYNTNCFHNNSNVPFAQGTVDYKICCANLLVEGKILHRLWFNSKEQRHIATAIKTARVAGLLPFINQ
jgi:ribosomal protein S18